MENETRGHVEGYVKYLLQLEGLLVFCTGLHLYFSSTESSWQMFLILFLFPDLSFLGYLLGKKVGAFSYNLMHSYILPLFLFQAFWFFSLEAWNFILFIWITHIGFDRALGYGLKYSKGFAYTHLGILKQFIKS